MALINSRLDYCNGVLVGMPVGLSNLLQSVLRAAARLVFGLSGRAPVMSAIRDTLHWLTYPQRVTFKVFLTTYKCLHGLAPSYLTRLKILYTTCRHRRPHTPACALLVNTSCSSLVRLPPRWVHGRSAHRAHLRGTHSLGSFATQPSPSSSDNPSKPICLTVINCTVTCSLGIVTARAFVTVSV